MTVASPAVVGALLADILGDPVSVEVLKDKPGRRRTVRAWGPKGSVIVKAYANDRVPVVAVRLAALTGGPDEPALPRLLAVDPGARLVVLTDIPGTPLRAAVIGGDLDTCRRAGAALGRWHRAWAGAAPRALQPHPVERELAILEERAAAAPAPIADRVRRLAAGLTRPWPWPTVVHRDLYEEQILVGARIGLIDLDDAALGPPELDLGNLLAHLCLLAHRNGLDVGPATAVLLGGYRATGGGLDRRRLWQCEQLSRLRLACIHAEPALLATVDRPVS